MSDKFKLAMLAKEESDQGHIKRLSSKASVTYLVCKQTLAPAVYLENTKRSVPFGVMDDQFAAFSRSALCCQGKTSKKQYCFLKMELYYAAVLLHFTS